MYMFMKPEDGNLHRPPKRKHTDNKNLEIRFLREAFRFAVVQVVQLESSGPQKLRQDQIDFTHFLHVKHHKQDLLAMASNLVAMAS